MVMKKLVYYLDSDVKEFCEFQHRHEKYGELDVVTYSDVKGMVDDINDISKPRPDIILLDLFCKDPNLGDEAYTELLEEHDIEGKLKEFSKARKELYLASRKVWVLGGKQNYDTVKRKVNAELNVPIAISSRYGRRLVDSPDFNDWQEEGIKWVWKYKDQPSNKVDFDPSIASSEADSIDKVVNSHRKKAVKDRLIEDLHRKNRLLASGMLLGMTSIVCMTMFYLVLLSKEQLIEVFQKADGFSVALGLTLVGTFVSIVSLLYTIFTSRKESISYNKAFKSDS